MSLWKATFLTLLSFLLRQSEAFSLGAYTRTPHRVPSVTILYETPSDDTNEDDANEGGQELARQFYKFQKQQQQGQQSNPPQPRAIIEEDGSIVSYTAKNPQPQQSSSAQEDTTEPIKFTGQGSPLFGTTNISTNNPSTNNALDREREREFNLAGNFERTLPLQVAVLVASFALVIYVGVTGGITDGSDRGNYYYEEDDRIDYETMQRIQNEQNNNGVLEPQAPSRVSSSSKDAVWL